jgi:hypothetical protein
MSINYDVMSYDEFLARVHIAHQVQVNKESLRLGQIFMNDLHIARPIIEEQLRGSMLDPFFKERITQVVSDFVRERW